MPRFEAPTYVLPRFEAPSYVLPHFDALTHLVIRVPSALIFQTFAEVCYSVFVRRSSFKSLLNLQKAYTLHCLLNLPKRSSFKSLPLILLWIKPSTHIFQHGSSLFLENVCDSCCMHQTGLSGSAAFVPQSKFTELCSSAFVVLQSKSTELRSSAEVVPESKSTDFWSSAAVVPQSKSTEM